MDATLKALLGRPVAFYRPLREIAGSMSGALMLSQAVYWTDRTDDPEGWFYKTQAEWEAETGLNRTEQDHARAALRRLGFWQERRKGVPAKMHFRVDVEGLKAALTGQPVAQSQVADISQNTARTLEIFEVKLRRLSQLAVRRATLCGARVEYVDYAEILRRDDSRCYLCGEGITRGPGKQRDCLQFDHVVALCEGGSHTADNVRCTHAGCNLARRHGNMSGAATVANKPADVTQSSLPKSSNQERRTPARFYHAETTTETTAGKGDSVTPESRPASPLPPRSTPPPAIPARSESRTPDLETAHRQAQQFYHAHRAQFVAVIGTGSAKPILEALEGVVLSGCSLSPEMLRFAEHDARQKACEPIGAVAPGYLATGLRKWGAEAGAKARREAEERERDQRLRAEEREREREAEEGRRNRAEVNALREAALEAGPGTPEWERIFTGKTFHQIGLRMLRERQAAQAQAGTSATGRLA